MPHPEIHNASTAPCKGCGKIILWAITGDGTRIPLDQKAPTYIVRSNEMHDGLPVVDRSRAYVSHFSTCPQATQFSKKKERNHVD